MIGGMSDFPLDLNAKPCYCEVWLANGDLYIDAHWHIPDGRDILPWPEYSKMLDLVRNSKSKSKKWSCGHKKEDDAIRCTVCVFLGRI